MLILITENIYMPKNVVENKNLTGKDNAILNFSSDLKLSNML